MNPLPPTSSNDAESPTLNSFWFTHGVHWANHEAKPRDLETLIKIAKPLKRGVTDKASNLVISKLQKIWRNGFADKSDAFDWDGMDDQIPERSIIEFIRGVTKACEEKPSLLE